MPMLQPVPIRSPVVDGRLGLLGGGLGRWTVTHPAALLIESSSTTTTIMSRVSGAPPPPTPPPPQPRPKSVLPEIYDIMKSHSH